MEIADEFRQQEHTEIAGIEGRRWEKKEKNANTPRSSARERAGRERKKSGQAERDRRARNTLN